MNFFVLGHIFIEFFFMCPQPSFQTYYQLIKVIRHAHFTWKNSKVEKKNLMLYNGFIFRNFPCKASVLQLGSIDSMFENLVEDTWKEF
jgi:hypothetical protein